MLGLMLGVVLASFVPLISDSAFKHREDLLLSSLGFSAKPNPVSPHPVPPILWKIYKQRMASKKKQDLCFMEEFNVPGNIIRVFPDQGRFVPPSSGSPPPLNLCLEKRLFFNLSVIEQEERITMGQLELQFSQNTYYGQTFNLRLYRILQMSLKGMGGHKTSRKLLLGQTFRLLHKSLLFNLTDVCRIWRDPRKNLGLALEILHRGEGTFKECRGVQTFLYTSLLAVSLNPLQCRKPRKKRSYDRFPLMASNICMKRRLYVDFREFGWHKWVIAPRGFLANYCAGECPFPLTEFLNSTNHAVLQTLAHSYDPEDIPLPCCIATKMAPVSMLLYDNDDNVVLRHYEDMAVAECGCR